MNVVQEGLFWPGGPSTPDKHEGVLWLAVTRAWLRTSCSALSLPAGLGHGLYPSPPGEIAAGQLPRLLWPWPAGSRALKLCCREHFECLCCPPHSGAAETAPTSQSSCCRWSWRLDRTLGSSSCCGTWRCWRSRLAGLVDHSVRESLTNCLGEPDRLSRADPSLAAK